MKKTLLLAASAVVMMGCSSDSTDEGAVKVESSNDKGVVQATNAMQLTEHEQKMTAPLNDFSLNLFRQAAGEHSQVVSPLGTAFVLGMLCEGADAKASEEILSVLHMEGEGAAAVSDLLGKYVSRLPVVDKSTTLALSNNVTVNDRYRLTSRFTERVVTLYDASVFSLDFTAPETVGIINRWSNDHSSGLIPQIIDNLDASAAACLLNAVYLKATWKEPFSKGDSRVGTFMTADGTVTRCQMMHRTGNAEYCEQSGMKALRLPLGDGSYAMTLLLPDAADGLPSLLTGLNTKHLAALPFASQSVSQTIPSFLLSADLNLVPMLMALGVKSVFDPLSKSLPNMVEDESGLFVSQMKQKVKIGLNEEGTEAAAVTIAEITYSYNPRQKASGNEFRADHPFAFIISETSTGTILFIGQYTGK